jgi:lipoyl(octanoyl) transferase
LDAVVSDKLKIMDLGRTAYAPALEVQRKMLEDVLAGAPGTLIFVEHDPVITVSQRRESQQHLLASPERLKKLGIDVQPTDRGGDITYHGPGQLVAYPILKLDDYGLNLSRYMRLLEDVVIDTLSAFGVKGETEKGVTGVWVREIPASSEPQAIGGAKKICALGVRIRRNVTMHGLALNVTTDISHFDTIVPCGLTGRGVTSLAKLLGERTPSMNDVKRELATAMNRRLAGTRAGALPQ